MSRVGQRLTASIVVAAAALLAASAAGAAGAAQREAARDTPARAIEVAAGVYMMQGAPGEVDTMNLGRIGNAGFIVGDAGVVAIDTGTSYRHGVALLAAIRRVTDKPVLLALITHTRQEFLFGAAAYREQTIPIHMHRKAAALMQSLARNHVFIDGNKRIAFTLAVVFLGDNGLWLKVSASAAERFLIDRVIGAHAEIEEIAAWLEKHSTSRPVT